MILCTKRSGAGFTTFHMCLDKKIMSILAFRYKDVFCGSVNFQAKKIMHVSQIFHREQVIEILNEIFTNKSIGTSDKNVINI